MITIKLNTIRLSLEHWIIPFMSNVKLPENRLIESFDDHTYKLVVPSILALSITDRASDLEFAKSMNEQDLTKIFQYCVTKESIIVCQK